MTQLEQLMQKYGEDARVYDVLMAELQRLQDSNKSQRKDLKKMRRLLHRIKKSI